MLRKIHWFCFDHDDDDDDDDDYGDGDDDDGDDDDGGSGDWWWWLVVVVVVLVVVVGWGGVGWSHRGRSHNAHLLIVYHKGHLAITLLPVTLWKCLPLGGKVGFLLCYSTNQFRIEIYSYSIKLPFINKIWPLQHPAKFSLVDDEDRVLTDKHWGWGRGVIIYVCPFIVILTSIGNSIVEMRRSYMYDCLFSTMGFPILVKLTLLILKQVHMNSIDHTMYTLNVILPIYLIKGIFDLKFNHISINYSVLVQNCN